MFPPPIIAITLVVAFISQDVAAGHSSSTTVATPTTGDTSSAASPPATTEASTTKPPQKPTCGEVTFIWKKPWNDSYVDNTQFVSDTTNKLKTALSKYEDVKVSKLQVTNEKGDTLVEFKLCFTNRDKNSYLEDELTDKLDITELKFEASGVTFKDWKAKDGECKKCSEGGAGPIIIERECEPKEQYSCNGVKTTKESRDCVEYCSARSISGVQKISTFILVLGIVLAFSVNFWK